VIALQTIASRFIDPTEQVVVSVTSFETSSKAHNVLPQSVDLRGTIRTLNKDVRTQAADLAQSISAGVAATFGAQVEYQFFPGYPAMVNHEAETKYAAEAATKISGSCDNAPLIMGGEDFAYMLEERPGAYILVGNGDSAPVHHPKFNFNDEILPVGSSWYAQMVESRLPVA
jgi:hippurate hydrolase